MSWDMRKMKAITIIGPNGVGKTAIAFELARRLGGEVINLDKIYLFKYFPISSGLSDTLREKDIQIHLYELLEPDQDIIPGNVYAEMVREKCEEIEKRNALPIIEGGSTTYFPPFHDMNRRTNLSKIFGLKFPANFDVAGKIKRRIEFALKEGLLEEVKQNLPKYRDTLIMKDGHAVVPLVKYLDGEIDFETAKSEIAGRGIKYIERQMELFSRYPDIMWLEHESSLLPQTVEKIINIHTSA